MSKAKEVRELKTIIEQQELVIDWLLLQLEKRRQQESCRRRERSSVAVMQCLRWMIRHDQKQLEALEAVQPDRWPVELWIESVRQGNRVAFVAEFDGEIVGAMLYRFSREALTVERIIGDLQEAMHQRLIDKLQSGWRKQIEYDLPIVRTHELLLLQELGYVPRDAGRDLFTDEPIVRMVYEQKGET